MTKILFISLITVVLSAASAAQTNFPHQRTVTKTDRFDFRSGGTVTITGAPDGSIEVIGSAANEVEITAEIKLQARSDEDLKTLAASTGFVMDESTARVSITTIGSHNKFGLKKLPKDLAKELLTLPFTINYVVRVPRYTDLEIDGGKGDLTISGVEGSIRANFLESNAKIDIVGGIAAVAIGIGNADISFGVKGWRGRSASIQIARGDMMVRLPTTLSADIDANVLRSGRIENEFPDLKPRDRKTAFTERSMIAKAGVGGGPINLSVGEGSLRIGVLRSHP